MNCTLSDTGIAPVILYFNQAVEGINSSTVAIKSELLKEKLCLETSFNKQLKYCHVWIAYLNLGNMELQPPKTYSVEASIGHFAYTEPAEGQDGKMTTGRIKISKNLFIFRRIN
ncbi:hypothetical protein E2542_SST15775 [Spatholobus suberectus]|nr:hypothetical protein E2542_SST15775 [Spatholobus suberectus]